MLQAFLSQRLEVGSKKLSPFKTVLFGKKIFLQRPSLISSYTSLGGTGSQGSLGSQAEGCGAGSASTGHAVSPNKTRALLGRRKWGMNGCFYARTHACHTLWNLKLFVSLYKECSPEIYPVSALCLSWWKLSPVTLLNKLYGLLNWVKTSSSSLTLG